MASPFVRLWIPVALMLLASSHVLAQAKPRRQDLRAQVIEAVRLRNETALLALMRNPAGRQELLALSDDRMFEISAAKMLAGSLPQSPEVRQALRQIELSLLRQTDDGSVVKELCLGLLVSEMREVRDASSALRLADSLYDDAQRDLNDVVVREGRVVLGEKSKTISEMAASLAKAGADPGRLAFLKRILARAPVSPNQTAEAPTAEAPIWLKASGLRKKFRDEPVWQLLLTYAGVLLMVLLAGTIGWRINNLRKGLRIVRRPAVDSLGLGARRGT